MHILDWVRHRERARAKARANLKEITQDFMIDSMGTAITLLSSRP